MFEKFVFNRNQFPIDVLQNSILNTVSFKNTRFSEELHRRMQSYFFYHLTEFKINCPTLKILNIMIFLISLTRNA